MRWLSYIYSIVYTVYQEYYSCASIIPVFVVSHSAWKCTSPLTHFYILMSCVRLRTSHTRHYISHSCSCLRTITWSWHAVDFILDCVWMQYLILLALSYMAESGSQIAHTNHTHTHVCSTTWLQCLHAQYTAEECHVHLLRLYTL